MHQSSITLICRKESFLTAYMPPWCCQIVLHSDPGGICDEVYFGQAYRIQVQYQRFVGLSANEEPFLPSEAADRPQRSLG